MKTDKRGRKRRHQPEDPVGNAMMNYLQIKASQQANKQLKTPDEDELFL